MPVVLVDAGPLVALFDRSDPHHRACRDALRSIREALGSVWPVVSEAMSLLSFSGDARNALWEMVEAGTVTLLPLDRGDVPRMRTLMRKYRDLPMDLADAALVRVAERDDIHRIFTLDRRDFGLYRPTRIGRFTLIP